MIREVHGASPAGKYTGTAGHGLINFGEDVIDHDRMTLVGRITR
jgi:hypothetical protein